MAGKKGRRGWGWIRRSGSATWHASYIGPDCIRHNAPKTFSAKIDAEGWLASERRLVEFGTWTPPAQREAQRVAAVLTVAAYAATWIEQRQLRPRTRMGYESILENRVKATTVGAIALRDLTPTAVRAWFAALATDRPTAKAHAYQFLHAVCATAVTDGLLAANPCNIPKAMAAKTIRQAVILEPCEVAALADGVPERLRALILLAAWCGPRWGEVVELRRRDVSDDCSVLTIARGATHRAGQCHVDSPKSGKVRNVVVPPHIRVDLARHLERHVAKGPAALLFPPTRGGCHLNDKVFRGVLNPALAGIGRDGVKRPRPTIHDLRHFAGTQTARVGNLVETMGRLGHSTVKASLIYQQIVSGRDAEVADALSRLAIGAPDDVTEPVPQ